MDDIVSTMKSQRHKKPWCHATVAVTDRV